MSHYKQLFFTANGGLFERPPWLFVFISSYIMSCYR